MATTPRSLSGPSPAAPSPGSPRPRLRAVDRDETADVTWLLPPGATWLPAPPHTLPALPGRPAMTGYLVLVPADRQPPFPAALTGFPPHPPAAGPETAGVPDGPGPYEGGGDTSPLRVDTERRTAEVDGRELDLTYLEFELLAHLVAHPGQVHSRDRLVSTVWGYGHVGDGRTVDVHVARLRRKLGAEYRTAIRTVRRVGYKYVPPAAR